MSRTDRGRGQEIDKPPIEEREAPGNDIIKREETIRDEEAPPPPKEQE